MPLIQIHLVQGRDRPTLRKLAKRVTDTVEEVLDAPRESIRVQINEMDPEFWVVGGQSVAERRAASGQA